MDFEIVDATPADVPAIFGLICELAEYEKLRHEVEATPELLHKYLFDEPRYEAFVARSQGAVVGYALYFWTFSTFVGRPGLYLEDLFVQPTQRKKGMGRALIKAVARRAVERKCGRLEWSVLDWNAPSIAFYQSLGAQTMSGWNTMRLAGDELEQLAAE
jgi:GNAT superfamily N-acetyltransferase